jgi:hypothetical protein
MELDAMPWELDLLDATPDGGKHLAPPSRQATWVVPVARSDGDVVGGLDFGCSAIGFRAAHCAQHGAEKLS